MSATLAFKVLAQGMSLGYLALEASGNGIPGSHETLPLGETVLGRLPLLHCTAQIQD